MLLRLLLAAGALLAGLDLHALEVWGPAGTQQVPDSQVQVHADGCPHHEHLQPAHDAHGCVACKAGATRAAGLLPDVAVRPARAQLVTSCSARTQVAPAPLPGGQLGARGPPGTNG